MSTVKVPPFIMSPEKRSTIGTFLKRQLFVTPPVVDDVDLTGKTAIVTGSNRGIDLECARQLLILGLTKLILAVADEKKGHDAKSTLLRTHGGQLSDDTIEVWKLDYLSYESIVSFTERAKTLKTLDIVVLNAGVLKTKFEVTNEADLDMNASTTNPNVASHEHSIQINVLSTALLAILLLPSLKPKMPPDQAQHPGGGRLTVVSSDTASWAKLKNRHSRPLLRSFDTPKSFVPFKRYCDSKLLGQMIISELARRVDPSLAVITLPNPGLAYGTNLGRSPGFSISDRIGGVLKRVFGRSRTVAARTVTAGAACFGPEAHGMYVEDGKLQPLAPLIYKPEGERVSEVLWKEALAEFSFAPVEAILAEVAPKSRN